MEPTQLSCPKGYKMEQSTPYETHAKIMRRVSKSDTCKYGAVPATTIPPDKPCVVIFGGELTRTIKDANYYASMMMRLIDFYGLRGVDVYSAYYDFDTKDRKAERKNVFIDARSKILNKGATKQIADTQYIQDLYDIIIQPRIVDSHGDKLPDLVALQNIRNIIIYTHSHGSVPAYAFQGIMLNNMRKYGYETNVIRDIMKNLLIVQHAPVSPLEKSKFNTVSFMSANDTKMNFHNKFSEYVTEHNEDLLPSYFPLGNFFAVYGFTYQLIDEHQINGLVPNKGQDMLTPDGAIIMAAERNTLINGLDAARRGVPIPAISELIAPVLPSDTVRPDFDTLAQNGESFMRLMQYDMRAQKSNER